MTGCVCEQGGARFTEFESRDVGRDETEGRFADVTLNRCRTCGRTWLRYLVEYEAFSRSGRWARGLISEADGNTITPETAVAPASRPNCPKRDSLPLGIERALKAGR